MTVTSIDWKWLGKQIKFIGRNEQSTTVGIYFIVLMYCCVFKEIHFFPTSKMWKIYLPILLLKKVGKTQFSAWFATAKDNITM